MTSYIEPHAENSLLLTVDVQNDFTLPEGKATIPGTQDCVPRMKRLVESFRSQSQPIIHAVRLYLPDGSNVDACRRGDVESGTRIVPPDSDGAELVEGLRRDNGIDLDSEKLLAGQFQSLGEKEWLMYKPRWSGFYRTPLESRLEELSVDTLVVCGCNFPNCPRATIYDASERDFRVVFVSDATSGTYDRGLEELDNIGVAVMETSEAVDWFNKGTN